MSRAITAIFGADSSEFVKEMQKMEAIAARTGAGITRSMSSTVLNPSAAKNAANEYVSWWNKAFSQTGAAHEKQMAYLAKKAGIMGTMGSGMAPGFAKLIASEASAAGEVAGKAGWKGLLSGFSGMSGSGFSQIVSVISNTMSSLGSGMNPLRVFMQQAPNVAQAFIMMGRSILAWAGPIAAALAVVGGAVYLVIEHFKRLREAKNLVDLMDLTRTAFSDTAAAMRDAAASAREFNGWLEDLGRTSVTAAERVELLLRKMREEFELQQELARAKGQTRKQSAQATIEELQKELLEVTTAKLQANRELELAKIESQDAENNLTAFNQSDAGGNRIGKAKKSSEKLLNIIEQLENIEKNIPKTAFAYSYDPATHTSRSYEIPNPDLGRQHSVKVGDEEFRISLAEAKTKYLELYNEEQSLLDVQKKLSKLVEDKKKLSEDDQRAYNDLVKQEELLASDLELKRKFLPQIAKASDSARRGGDRGFSLNSQQRIGAYAAVPPDWRILLQNVASIARNTSHLTPGRREVGASKPQWGGATHR